MPATPTEEKFSAAIFNEFVAAVKFLRQRGAAPRRCIDIAGQRAIFWALPYENEHGA